MYAAYTCMIHLFIKCLLVLTLLSVNINYICIAVMELSTSSLLEQLSWHQKQMQAGRVIHCMFKNVIICQFRILSVPVLHMCLCILQNVSVQVLNAAIFICGHKQFISKIKLAFLTFQTHLIRPGQSTGFVSKLHYLGDTY